MIVGKEEINLYGDHVKDRILARLMQGESLNRICKDEGYPAESTVRLWVLRGDDPEFSANYAHAREIQAERFADELIDIADSSESDFTADAEGNKSLNRQAIERDKLRLDTRKWIISKILPKVYGDKLQTSNDTKITVSVEYSAPPLPSAVEQALEAEYRDIQD